MVGNLFYGTEGWAAMSDQGFQAYKGESNELIMEERPERGTAAMPPACTCRTSSPPCRSRNEKELHDPLSNAYLSASLCHLANISYRVGRKLTLEAGPEVHRRRRSQQDADARCLPQALRSLTEPSLLGVPAYETVRRGTPKLHIYYLLSSVPKAAKNILDSCGLCAMLCLTQKNKFWS